MEKKILSLFMAVCFMILCLPQAAFAKEMEPELKDIDSIYEKAYAEALKNVPEIIDSEEDAYAYILTNQDCVNRINDDPADQRDIEKGIRKYESEH